MAEKCFSLRALKAGHGDCLWIEYGSLHNPRRILVDGGPKGTGAEVESIITGLEESAQIELLVVTHIDDDHIAGILSLLEKGHLQRFDEVWFNGRKHLLPGADIEDFGVAQGERLTTALLPIGPRWNKRLGGGQISLSEDGEPHRLPVEHALRITVLSPGWTELAALYEVWDAEIGSADLDPGNPLTVVEEIDEEYEALGTGDIDVDALADEETAEDDKEANCSSIALLLEFEGKKLLLGADARPSVLVDSVSKLTAGAPLPLDLFKLPHHGSKKNISKRLLQLLPSRSVLISTNGAYHQHPDMQAVARVIKYSPRGVELIFNCKTIFNSMWESPKLKKKWGYTTVYGDEHGVQVDLL